MGGGAAVMPSSTPSSPSCSSETLHPEFDEYVAVSDDADESNECCVCDDPKVEALHYACARRRLHDRSLREAKDLIRRYKPGDWIEGASGTKSGDYVLPKITTLLLVGLRGAGKSTLANRITRVFDDPFAPDQVQVSRDSKSNGTNSLREYPVPRNSNALCVYDTPSFSSNPKENFEMLHRWMTKGVSHGEVATWNTDHGTRIKDMKPLRRKYNFLRCKNRKVNFVIFVVDGISVLESIYGPRKGYTETLRETFLYPFLSIGDDKPVVVVTHGDRLSMQQCALVRNELAELLDIPVQQIFDIPGSDDYQTDLVILDMLCYCIQHAEQNLPIKLSYLLKVHGRDSLKNFTESLMGLDAVIEATIILLCIVILLLRVSDKLLRL